MNSPTDYLWIPLVTGDNAFERITQLDLILLPPR